jgi:hypothetical protein
MSSEETNDQTPEAEETSDDSAESEEWPDVTLEERRSADGARGIER